MRSTSFEITIVAIVRVLLVMEKRVRSTSFSNYQYLEHSVNYHGPKIVVIRVIIDVMRLLLRCNNDNYGVERPDASVGVSLPTRALVLFFL